MACEECGGIYCHCKDKLEEMERKIANKTFVRAANYGAIVAHGECGRCLQTRDLTFQYGGMWNDDFLLCPPCVEKGL